MSLDCRLLIKQVKARPALWDRGNQDYCHKVIASKLWAEIALTHGVHESRVRSKWKALRDTFRQELKKNAQKSPWNYYLDMQFLKGQIKTLLPPKGPEFEDDFIIVKMESEKASCQEETEGDDMGCASRVDVEPESERPHVVDDKNDDDYHFLMSLLPEMRRLEPRQKLLLRIRIMELFYQVVYQKEF